MVTKEQFNNALKTRDDANTIIGQYFKEQRQRFAERLLRNPIFTDDELVYSATTKCLCGHGMAYPRECGPGHYWDCSAILKGIANENVKHMDQLPFAYYSIDAEGDYKGTTRPKK